MDIHTAAFVIVLEVTQDGAAGFKSVAGFVFAGHAEA